MFADYSHDAHLFPRCMSLLDTIFPGCKSFAEKGEKYHASWRQGSTPFIIEHEGEIIAHAGIWPVTLMLNANEHQCAFIHGVGVKAEHRSKGHFKELMRQTMEYATKHYDSFALFTVKPYLYSNFPLKLMLPEYDFVFDESTKFRAKKSDLRLLSLDNEQDLALIHQLLLNRVPLSREFSTLGKNSAALFILNSMNKKIHYSEKLNAMIMFDIRNDALFLSEVVSTKHHHIDEIIEILPANYHKIVLQFCPDQFLDKNEYSAVLAGPECSFMVSSNFNFSAQCFRYPELYWC